MPSSEIEEPHYKRIRRHIEMQIRRGELSLGHRLPGERDIASQFGVSQMTANKALHELVREGWLERRVGSGTYVSERPNLAGTLPEISVVLVTPFTDHPEEDVYLQAPFLAISAQITRENGSLLVTQSPEKRFGQVVDRYPHAGFIFVAPAEESYSTLCQLNDQHVPFVVLGASWPSAKFACVDSDNVGGTRTAVEYLRRLGHTRIGFINGVAEAPNCRDRFEGYRNGMEGLSPFPLSDWVVEAGSNWELSEASRRQVTDLLIRREPVTAILCAGFYLTMSLFDLLRGLQLHVPRDVSVIGFDDSPVAARLSPPLTTIKQPLSAMGERAVQRVLALLSGADHKTAGVETLPTDLVVRRSCERMI